MNAIPISPGNAQEFMALKKPKIDTPHALNKPSDVGNLKGKSDDAEALRNAAKQFESVFMSQMLKQMRSTVHKEEMFHGGAGEDIFTEMLDEKFAEKMSERGTGIADMLFRQLSRQFGIGEEDQALPSTTESGNRIQEKLREMQRQIQQQEPQPTSVNI